MCLLLGTSHQKDNSITVCGKWIFDSNLDFALRLTKALLNYIFSGNNTDVLASELDYIGDEIASEYIIRRKQQSLACIHSNDRIQFCRDALMGQSREKSEQTIHYQIQE